ncbi:aspartate kinase [Balamuthia mandrillaris]
MEQKRKSQRYQWWQRKAETLLEITTEARQAGESSTDGLGGEGEDSLVWKDVLAADPTPLYVYDQETIVEVVTKLKTELACVDRFFYAVKANPYPKVLQTLYELGLGFECVSPGELQHVLQLFPELSPGRGRLLFTPNFVSRREYELAFRVGAVVTLDSLYPLQHWPDIFRNREVMIRVDPMMREGHHNHVKTAGHQSKFGVTVEDLRSLLPGLLESSQTRLVGLHAHVGSGIMNPQTWKNTADLFLSLLPLFPDVKVLDLGGGLGVVYKYEQEGHEANTNGLALSTLNELLSSFRKEQHLGEGVQLWMEPGRYCVAEAGVLLARVTQLKQKGEKHYVGVNTGFNSLLRPALYSAYHHIVNLSKWSAAEKDGGESSSQKTKGSPFHQKKVQVVGNICESGDVLGEDRELAGETEEGDILLIAVAGAYGHCMSSSYNLREPAREIFLATTK